MALVLVMQGGLIVLGEELLPGRADRGDGRTQLPADRGVGVGDGLLRFRRVLPRPRHVENRLRTSSLNCPVEEADVLVHPLRVLDRQHALLLKYHRVVLALVDRLGRATSVPVGTQRRTAGADEAV